MSSLQLAADGKVGEASRSIKCGRKWKPQLAVDDATSRLRHQDVVGTVCKGRLGLGNYDGTTWAAANPKARRRMIVEQVRETEEEERQLHLRSLTKQGAWMRWESALERKLSWNDVWQMEQGKLSFILRSVLDLLPSPANLKLWGRTDDTKCNICGIDNCTLQHIVSSCKKSLTQGRYRWRHDQVLRAIAGSLDEAINRANQNPRRNSQTITFVKAGQKR